MYKFNFKSEFKIACSQYFNFQLCLLDIFYKMRLTDRDEKVFKKPKTLSDVVKKYSYCK